MGPFFSVCAWPFPPFSSAKASVGQPESAEVGGQRRQRQPGFPAGCRQYVPAEVSPHNHVHHPPGLQIRGWQSGHRCPRHRHVYTLFESSRLLIFYYFLLCVGVDLIDVRTTYQHGESFKKETDSA